MAKRKSVTVFGITAGVLALFSVLLFICFFARNYGGDAFNGFIEAFKQTFAHFGEFSTDVGVTIGLIIISALSLLILICWLCAGIKRKRFIFLYGILLLLVSYVVTIVNLYYSPYIFNLLIEGTGKPLDTVEFLFAIVTFVFVVVLHFVDMVTGRKAEPVITETNHPVEEAPVIEEAVSEPAEASKAEVAPVQEEVPVQTTPVPEEETTIDSENKEEEVKVAKKAPAKKPAKKAPAKKPAKETKKETKVYHVSKRAEDGLWVVKFAGGEKVIKTFKTRREAVDWADVVAKNQEGVVLTHASKGAKQGKINAKRRALKD